MAGEMQDAAGAPVTDAIYDVIRNFHLTNIRDDEGGDYPLVDAMTCDGLSISDGEEQMRELAYAIAQALAHPPAAEREAPGGVVVPEGWHPPYDYPIADAGQAYINSVAYQGAHTLPAMFRWEELWDAMCAAAAPPPPAPIGAEGAGEREKALRAMFDAGVAQGFEAGDNPSHNYATVKSDDEAFLAAIAALTTPAEGQGK